MNKILTKLEVLSALNALYDASDKLDLEIASYDRSEYEDTVYALEKYSSALDELISAYEDKYDEVTQQGDYSVKSKD